MREVQNSAKFKKIADGYTLSSKIDSLRIHFVGSCEKGFDIVFEKIVNGEWQCLANFPAKQIWTVYASWNSNTSWYEGVHHFKATKIEEKDSGCVKVSAQGIIFGQKWEFRDIYSIEHSLIKIERVWEHLEDSYQPEITLANCVRVPLGDDPQVLIPGVIYNNNPNAYPTKPVPHIAYAPGAIGLYEEHRLPIPMVNLESTIQSQRIYGSLLSIPSRLPQGHKGSDQWWSLGLKWGENYVDLLSVSGAVATNGFFSMVYGHRNGFDPYDRAYIDVRGKIAFKKTLYIDPGISSKKGYSFSKTLWKAFDIFQPVSTPHLPFSEVMSLKKEYAKSTFFQDEKGVAGFPIFPGVPILMYEWVGGNLAIAYALLFEADRCRDQQARKQAMKTIQFFIENAQAKKEGLYYGDYDVSKKQWVLGNFWGQAPGISSRQFGEIMERLADLILLGRKQGLKIDSWLTALRKGCDFLLQSPRYEDLFPRKWDCNGIPMGWEDKKAKIGSISTSGVYCVIPLAKISKITKEKKYLDAAKSVLEAYWKKFSKDLSTPYWGATLDAGSEDKEAGWGFMRAALAVYESTQDSRYLSWAKDAGDWTLTWMYFYDVGFLPTSILYDHLNTIGWTSISVQNEEIDVFGYFMAPDFYRLGLALKEERYKQIAKVMFNAATQTISRPGEMFGRSEPGIQAEHYNHTNCTYIPQGTWRGSQWAAGISWVVASALYGGVQLEELGAFKR